MEEDDKEENNKKKHFFKKKPIKEKSKKIHIERVFSLFTLILVPSAPKPVAADNRPKNPATKHINKTFLSIIYLSLYLSIYHSLSLLAVFLSESKKGDN